MKNTSLRAFNNDQKVKDMYLARVKAHAEADEIVKGSYWQNGKGCAVGCTIEGTEHEKYETELGISAEIAYLEDVIFEELPNAEAMKFPLQFLEAVPVGADLSGVVTGLVIWQFENPEYGLKNIKEVSDDKELMGSCEEVVALYRRSLTEEVSEQEYYDLYLKIDGAGAGAWAGAWAGARARAWVGAWAGAWAGARAWVGARAWAGAKYDSRIIAMRDEFLRLLREAPVK